MARNHDDNGGWMIRGRGALNLLRGEIFGPPLLGRWFQGHGFRKAWPWLDGVRV